MASKRKESVEENADILPSSSKSTRVDDFLFSLSNTQDLSFPSFPTSPPLLLDLPNVESTEDTISTFPISSPTITSTSTSISSSTPSAPSTYQNSTFTTPIPTMGPTLPSSLTYSPTYSTSPENCGRPQEWMQNLMQELTGYFVYLFEGYAIFFPTFPFFILPIFLRPSLFSIPLTY